MSAYDINKITADMKLRQLKREAWIKNVMNKLGYTRQQAEDAYNRIKP